ncbi:acyl carrier protein [Streptomyces sp. NBC_01235]|uniref:acyl carrier protein n=1 Tax=Streptomyces sp. NBC_01235 TaxID=2903788 RepID=UPI002E168820|nr:phosphopantetheine-binding protein [Streptomyces sp. NBC_01235]
MSALPPEVMTWIYEQNPDVEDIDLDLDLFDTRLVNSLSLIEFVVVIERVSGRVIDRRQLKTEDFQTLRTIQEKFFDGSADSASAAVPATVTEAG